MLAVALFAPEISSLHVRSIWFPFGTGVSRTQFAYVGFDVALFILLWYRLLIFAAMLRHPRQEPIRKTSGCRDGAAPPCPTRSKPGAAAPSLHWHPWLFG